MIDKITAEELKNTLNYDLETGLFTWKRRNAKRNIGDPAGYIANGYVQIQIRDKSYKAHRLAWLYVYNKWPDFYIDHINGIPHDNRIVNLRDVSHRENHSNLKRHRDGLLVGTTFRKAEQKWQAQITYKSERFHLGLYPTQEQAFIAYCGAKNFLEMLERRELSRQT
jgi:hypothetical protein